MKTLVNLPSLLLSLSPKVALNLTLGATVGIFSWIIPPVNAQTINPDDGYQTNEVDPLYGGNGGSFNPLELLHRANLGSGNAEVFNETLDSNLNNASQDFRSRQLELLRQQRENSVDDTAEVEVVEETEP